MMVYAVKNTQAETWFATFTKSDDWDLHTTKGIDRDAVQELMDGAASSKRSS